MGFPHSSVGKESACNAGDPSLIPGLGRSPGEGIGYPLQYSWASLVAQPVKNPPVMWETWVDPWVGTIPWRRERLPTPVFWPGEFHELYSPWGLKESDTTEWLSLSLTLNMWVDAMHPVLQGVLSMAEQQPTSSRASSVRIPFATYSAVPHRRSSTLGVRGRGGPF